MTLLDFSVLKDFTQMVDIPSRIPYCDSHSTVLDLFLSFDPSIYSGMAFPPLGNSNHALAWISIDFLLNLSWDAPFDGTAFYYSAD